MSSAIPTSMPGGGIEIYPDEKLINTRVETAVYVDSEGLLKVTFEGGKQVLVKLTRDEMHEFNHIINKEEDSKTFVSIDSVDNENFSNIDYPLHNTAIGELLINEDSEIAGVMDGRIELKGDISKEVLLFPDQLVKLLDPNTGNKQYMIHIAKYVTPPVNWHSTVIYVTMTEDNNLELNIDISPNLIYHSPDGRRIPIELGEEKKIAELPFLPVVERLEKDPGAFFETLPELETVLRYAEAYAILNACKKSGVPIPTAKLFSQVADSEKRVSDEKVDEKYIEKLDNLTLDLLYERLSLAIDAPVNILWRKCRLNLDPNILTTDQRISLVADEIIYHLSTLNAANRLSRMMPISTGLLSKFLKNLDMDKEKYGGWGLLGQFGIGVWEGHPPDELIKIIERTFDRAEAENDYLLKYYMGTLVHDMMPIIRSNIYIAKLKGEGIEDDIYTMLYLIERNIQNDFPKDIAFKFDRMEKQNGKIFDSNGKLIASKEEVLNLMETFNLLPIMEKRYLILYELGHDRNRNEDPVLYEYGRLHYAIGLINYEEQNFDEVKNRSRMIESIAYSAKDNEAYSTHVNLIKLSNELKDLLKQTTYSAKDSEISMAKN